MRTIGKSQIFCLGFLLIAGMLSSQHSFSQYRWGQNDTIICPAVVFEGDTIEAKILAAAYVYKFNKRAKAKWTRLRNAVFVAYPYARRAGLVFNDIEKNIATIQDKKLVASYINSREKELKKEFSEPLSNLSVYQGKVLMKLINRESGGTNCYDIVKELKGGFSARFWQTVAFLFGSDLKQPYEPYGNDADIETIVQEVRRMYGYRS